MLGAVIAGIGAVGALGNAVNQVAKLVLHPTSTGSNFDQQLKVQPSTGTTYNPKAAAMASILQGRPISALSAQEQQSLGRLLVGSNVQLQDVAGGMHVGQVEAMYFNQGGLSLQVSGMNYSMQSLNAAQLLG